MSEADFDAVKRVVADAYRELATKDDLRRMIADFKRWLLLTAIGTVLAVSLTVGMWERLH